MERGLDHAQSMSGSKERERSVVDRLAEQFERDEEPVEVPRFVTASLGLVAAVLVGASTLSAVEAGYNGIALSFLSAVVLFFGTVLVFEAGRWLGADE
jgi:hypothetical protein